MIGHTFFAVGEDESGEDEYYLVSCVDGSFEKLPPAPSFTPPGFEGGGSFQFVGASTDAVYFSSLYQGVVDGRDFFKSGVVKYTPTTQEWTVAYTSLEAFVSPKGEPEGIVVGLLEIPASSRDGGIVQKSVFNRGTDFISCVLRTFEGTATSCVLDLEAGELVPIGPWTDDIYQPVFIRDRFAADKQYLHDVPTGGRVTDMKGLVKAWATSTGVYINDYNFKAARITEDQDFILASTYSHMVFINTVTLDVQLVDFVGGIQGWTGVTAASADFSRIQMEDAYDAVICNRLGEVLVAGLYKESCMHEDADFVAYPGSYPNRYQGYYESRPGFILQSTTGDLVVDTDPDFPLSTEFYTGPFIPESFEPTPFWTGFKQAIEIVEDANQ